MSRCSSLVSWGKWAREQLAPSGEDAAMEDCTESRNGVLTNMPENDSFRSKMQSLDDENAALLAAASGLCAPSESKLSAVSAGSCGAKLLPGEQGTTAVLCLWSMEQELILLSAKALLFLLALVGQSF